MKLILSIIAILTINMCYAQSTIKRVIKNKNNAITKRPNIRKIKSDSQVTKPSFEDEVKKLLNNMIYVQGGTFTMGATSNLKDDAFPSEFPVHIVNLSGYFICKYEVTQKLWEAVMNNNPSGIKGDMLPVDHVSWDDCQTFISKLNFTTGLNFRLPTEAEWEYACRGGNQSKGYMYSGSNNYNDVAWCVDNSYGTTHEIGTKTPNELGIYDMSGNVWEWCQDWHNSYIDSIQTNPTGASIGSRHTIRGGCCMTYARDCRPSARECTTASDYGHHNGFRLALSK